MPLAQYVAVCQECGKRGASVSKSQTAPPPSNTPTVSGTCPNSRGGKHNPRWERIR